MKGEPRFGDAEGFGLADIIVPSQSDITIESVCEHLCGLGIRVYILYQRLNNSSILLCSRPNSRSAGSEASTH